MDADDDPRPVAICGKTSRESDGARKTPVRSGAQQSCILKSPDTPASLLTDLELAFRPGFDNAPQLGKDQRQRVFRESRFNAALQPKRSRDCGQTKGMLGDCRARLFWDGPVRRPGEAARLVPLLLGIPAKFFETSAIFVIRQPKVTIVGNIEK
ncbi:hypothetical protein T8S45_10585 [Blastomonas marina]|nr:hypothetical protein [Blastomonas marina]WPZ03274.1 hypothetical protein T8S45_10585 [Blastomonas marina]